MEFTTFYAGKDDDGRRLDRVARYFLPEENLSKLYQSIRSGFIKVNKKKSKPEYRISEGDEIAVAAVLLSKTKAETESDNGQKKLFFPAFEKNNILFQNDYVLIINKPYDICVQGKNSLAEQAAALWKQESHNGQSLSFTPGPLHRLDRKTTGVLVFSRNLQGAQWFSNAFACHTVKKTYLALLEGRLPEKSFWQDFIKKEENRSTQAFHTVSASAVQTEKSLNAVTEAEPVSYGTYYGKDITLALIGIQTGRTHQIRSQCALHGFPLLGDTAYGGIKITESQDFFLHAYQLEIPQNNPLGIPSKITAFISTNFNKMLDKTLINTKGIVYN